MADDALQCTWESRTEMGDEDQILVAAAQADVQAAGKLYDKYYGRVLGYIYHSVFNEAVAEDLTANVFHAAFRHLGRYRWRQIPFRAWLYRIATNEIRMYYRRQKLTRTASLTPEHNQIADRCSSAEQKLATAEEYRLLHKALLELPLKYRTVIVLRYFEGKTMADIGDITGRKEGTVKSQLHRGLAQLQEILERWGMLSEE
jgi:RNA polymerase sigma-70 factor (ECF subfamily)